MCHVFWVFAFDPSFFLSDAMLLSVFQLRDLAKFYYFFCNPLSSGLFLISQGDVMLGDGFPINFIKLFNFDS